MIWWSRFSVAALAERFTFNLATILRLVAK
jgi:hypothetical protein